MVNVTPKNFRDNLPKVNITGISSNYPSNTNAGDIILGSIFGLTGAVATEVLAAKEKASTSGATSSSQTQPSQLELGQGLYTAIQANSSKLDQTIKDIEKQIKDLEKIKSAGAIDSEIAAADAEIKNLTENGKYNFTSKDAEGNDVSQQLSLDQVQTKLSTISTKESSISNWQGEITTLTQEAIQMKQSAKIPTTFSVDGSGVSFSPRTIDDQGTATGTTFVNQLESAINNLKSAMSLQDDDKNNDVQGFQQVNGLTANKRGKAYNNDALQSKLNLLESKRGDAIAKDNEVEAKSQQFKSAIEKEKEIEIKNQAIKDTQNEINKLRQELGCTVDSTDGSYTQSDSLIKAKADLEKRSEAISNKSNFENIKSQYSTTTTVKGKDKDGKETTTTKTEFDSSKVEAQIKKLQAVKASIKSLQQKAADVTTANNAIISTNNNIEQSDKADGNWFTRMFSRSKRAARKVTNSFKKDLSSSQALKQQNLINLYGEFSRMNDDLKKLGFSVNFE